jgi:hypothetical protein
LIQEIAGLFDALGIEWWLFGGWAMDFHAGEITRDHADVEIFVWAKDADRARKALVERGYAAPAGLHPDEGQPLLKDGQEVGLWFLTEAATNECGRRGGGRTGRGLTERSMGHTRLCMASKLP